jgi:sterol desaturase/sphingolipid hydroxylase (fatty acid hydroxylase superfamily)
MQTGGQALRREAQAPTQSRRRSRRLRAALLYGGLAGASLAAPSLARRLARRLPDVVAERLVLGGMIAAGWTTVAILERVRPFDPEWNRSRGDGRTDVAHMVLTGGLSQVVVMPAAAFLAPLRDRESTPWIMRLPLAARVAVLLCAFDFTHYWHHRLAHETATMWRFHSVHHSPERLYWGNAGRFHLVDITLDLLYEVAMLTVLRPDSQTTVAYTAFRAIYGQIQHCNIDVDSGPLNRVLASPEVHRWHHSTDPAEGNANYGAVVSLWDQLFGTLFLPRERAFDAELGIAGDEQLPEGWVRQFAAPFRRARN